MARSKGSADPRLWVCGLSLSIGKNPERRTWSALPPALWSARVLVRIAGLRPRQPPSPARRGERHNVAHGGTTLCRRERGFSLGAGTGEACERFEEAVDIGRVLAFQHPGQAKEVVLASEEGGGR